MQDCFIFFCKHASLLAHCFRGDSVSRSVEQVRKKSTPAFALVMAGAMAFIVFTHRGTRLRRRCGFRALDDLVEPSAFVRHAPALRSEMDPQALSHPDRLRDLAVRAEPIMVSQEESVVGNKSVSM